VKAKLATLGGGLANETGDGEPIVWFKQTIPGACGSYAFLHCALNGLATKFILPGSTLGNLRREAIPLLRDQRAQMLYDSMEFEEVHKAVAGLGDSSVPVNGIRERTGQYFVAFVKANGRLWELEDTRQGPLDRGALAEDEDALSPKALELGIKRIMRLERDSGGQDLRFSCIALAPEPNEMWSSN